LYSYRGEKKFGHEAEEGLGGGCGTQRGEGWVEEWEVKTHPW